MTLTEIHGLAAQVALVLVVVMGVFATALAWARRPPVPFFVGLVVWAGLMIAVAALTGLSIALGGHPPGNPLHIIYGLLAAAALPGAAVLAAGRHGTARAVIWAITGIVLSILVLRLFQTGG